MVMRLRCSPERGRLEGEQRRGRPAAGALEQFPRRHRDNAALDPAGREQAVSFERDEYLRPCRNQAKRLQGSDGIRRIGSRCGVRFPTAPYAHRLGIGSCSNSTETAVDKASQVYTVVRQLAWIDGCAGFDQRHDAADVLPAVQGGDGIDPPLA
jgi:hypothetical protein